jgi:FkbM family methyltransferase
MFREVFQSAAGRAGYRIKRKGVGDDYLQELVWQVGDVAAPVIFDVGAHRGETAKTFTEAFPDADLYCFEPFAESFEVLKKNKLAYPRASLINVGLSDSSSVQQFNVNVGSPTNSLLALDSRAAKTWSHSELAPSRQEACQFYTLDDFLTQQGIERVDLLKIDVQGAEYRVLQGGASSLSAGRVRVLYLEIILEPTYVGQWATGQYLSYLESMGFRLVGLYNFAYSSKRELIQLDALCVHTQ